MRRPPRGAEGITGAGALESALKNGSAEAPIDAAMVFITRNDGCQDVGTFGAVCCAVASAADQTQWPGCSMAHMGVRRHRRLEP